MTPTLGMLQGLMLNVAVTTAALVIFGAIVIFMLIYLLLERKKKTLVAVFMVVMAGYGAFYWFLGRKAQMSPPDAPKSVVTETIRKEPSATPVAVPLPRPRPRLRKKRPAPASFPRIITPQVQKQSQAIDICPAPLFN